MKKLFVSFFSVLALFVCFSLPLAAAELSALPANCSSEEWSVLRLTNVERLNRGLDPLSTFAAIQSASDIRAKEISNTFSHTRPNGESCFTVLKQIPYYSAGENIAAGQLSPAEVVAGWMNSEGHRANILTEDFVHMAPGYYYLNSGYYYHWVQLFIGGCEVTNLSLWNGQDVYNVGADETVDSLGLALEVTCDMHGKSYIPVTKEMCRGNLNFSSYQGDETITISAYGKTVKATLSLNNDWFRDVPRGSWFYDAVKFVNEQGYFNGTAPRYFAPNGSMTRAMLVTVLHRMEGTPAPAIEESFSDVPAGTWYTNAVSWAEEQHIVDGIGGGRFAPDGKVTREQIATILYRYSQFKGYDVSDRASFASFPDAGQVSAYAREALQWAVGTGLMVGSDGKLLPRDSATRAQVAMMIYRYANMYE